MSNIDDFNTILGLVFSQLYESFPIPRGIFPVPVVWDALEETEREGLQQSDLNGIFEAVCARADKLYDSMPVHERGAHLFRVYAAAIDWIRDEGYVRTAAGGGMIVLEAVLTLKGLQALSLVPHGLSASLGQEMVQKAKEGAKDGLRALVRKAISDWGPELLSALAKAAAST